MRRKDLPTVVSAIAAKEGGTMVDTNIHLHQTVPGLGSQRRESRCYLFALQISSDDHYVQHSESLKTSFQNNSKFNRHFTRRPLLYSTNRPRANVCQQSTPVKL